MTTGLMKESSAGQGHAQPARLREKLSSLAMQRFDRSIEAPKAFFGANADAIARATLAMARRFRSGGRLLVFGEGANATDAQHVSVEFVHPVIVGKRALPAIALTNDVATITSGVIPAESSAFAGMLAILGRADDIALGLHGDRESDNVERALSRARGIGMLTIAVGAHKTSGSAGVRCDHAFWIHHDDPLVVQEVSETLYHVLWELVHVFLDHMPDDPPETES